jgi:LPXTG-motif cell wall-anchored protein
MTAKNRFFFTLMCALMVLCSCGAALQATIAGIVLDNETMQPLEGIEVDIFPAGAQGAPALVAYTDVSGSYNVSVDPGKYDVRISKLGNVNLKRTVYAEEGSSKQVDFLVGLRNTAKTQPASGGNDLSFLAAAIILVAAAIYLLRKKKQKASEQPAEEPKKARPVVVASDELTLLKTERERLKHMMVVERKAFEERKINEERLKEVMSDYERSLEEIKRKISELEGA